jgi:hypothetical protein
MGDVDLVNNRKQREAWFLSPAQKFVEDERSGAFAWFHEP